MLTFYSTLKLWDFSKSKVRETEQVVSNNVVCIWIHVCTLPTLISI